MIEARKPFRDKSLSNEEYNNEYHKKMKSQLKKRKVFYDDALIAELSLLSQDQSLRAMMVA